MLQLFPFVSLLATAVSITLIAMLWFGGGLRPRGVALACGWLIAAGYCQFFTADPLWSATGLVLQTLLAIGLIVRWRLTI
jgi:hypothetical protein